MYFGFSCLLGMHCALSPRRYDCGGGHGEKGEGGGDPNGFSGCLSLLVFTPHFLRIMVEVATSDTPHVIKLRLG